MSVTFTEGETRLMILMMQHLQGSINVDWDAIVSKSGYASAGSAKRQWYKLKDKIAASAAKEMDDSEATGEKLVNKKAASNHVDGKRATSELDDSPSETKKAEEQQSYDR